MTSSRFIAEKLLLALVALTIGVLLFHPPLLEVRMVIAPGDPALRFELDSDVQDGGNTVTEWLDEGRLSWRCVLGDRFPYPFCGMQIHFSERYQDGIDLSGYSHINLRFDYRGDGHSVRLYLRNSHPSYTRPNEIRSTKFNMVEMNLQEGTEYRDVRLSYFRVADWWLQLYPLDMRDSTPDFTNVGLIELQTGSGLTAGEHVFTFMQLELVGSRLSVEQLYLSIIVIWILSILLYLAWRIHALSLAVRSSRLRQAELTEVNALLDQRSRTLEQRVKKDPLTGAYNRTGIEEPLSEAVHEWKHRRRPLSLLLLDVDHFKSVNDHHGHVAGDEVLRELTALVNANVRVDDHFARWGGEEFILVCRNTDLARAQALAESLRTLVDQHQFARSLHVTISIGVAQLQAGEALEALFSRADQALYAAKRQGRNRVVTG